MDDAPPDAAESLIAPPTAPVEDGERPARDPHRTARCPRCGYDQRGEISQWERSCPLESTCTECGLLIDWRELFNPDFSMPAWCVESAEKWRQIPWRTVKTLFMILRPWRFWRDLRMSHAIRWSRVTGLWILVLIALHSAMGVAQASFFYEKHASSSAFWGVVYPGNLVRDSLVQIAAPFAPVPLSDRWSSTALDYGLGIWSGGLIGVILYMLANGVMAFGFVLLPISRRRAKVRFSHIIRILFYGAVFTLPTFGVFALGAAAAADHWGPLDWALGWRLPALVAAVASMVIWWSLATGRYLRMPHAWAIGSALGVLATIAGTVMMASTGDRSFQDLLIALP